MQRVWIAFVVLVTSVSITPGVREMMIDVVRLAGDGHTAHVEDCEAANDDEHGCTGPFHVCACHTSMSMAPQLAALSRPVLLEHGVEHERSLASTGPGGHRRELLRPPTV